MTTYTNLTKPSGTTYTNQNSLGKYQYDEPSLTYDDSSTFYDGINLGAYTYLNKPTIVSSYSEANWKFTLDLLDTLDNTKVGMNFQCARTATLDSCRFFLTKTGNPTGTVVATLYNITGTYGVNSVPTGSALATSDTVSTSIIPLSTGTNVYDDYLLVRFNFTGANRYALQGGTNYVIAIEYGGGGTGNYIEVGGGDSNLPTGNPVQFYAGGWHTYLNNAYNFYVNSSPVYTNLAKPT